MTAMNKDEIDATAKVAKEIIKPIYEDGIKPANQEIGKSLQTVSGVINIALMPFSLLVHGFKEIEKNLKIKLTNKLSNISKEEIVSPPLNIVGPLLEKYKYNFDNELLSDMFISLLANSMDPKTANDAHPSFIDIIGQLSPDEARLFINIIKSETSPKIDVGIEYKGNNGYNILQRNLIYAEQKAGIQFPQNTNTYLDNLQRLNLIHFSEGMMQDAYVKVELYKPLEEDPLVRGIEQTIKPEIGKIKILRGTIRITDFGKTFYRSINR